MVEVDHCRPTPRGKLEPLDYCPERARLRKERRSSFASVFQSSFGFRPRLGFNKFSQAGLMGAEAFTPPLQAGPARQATVPPSGGLTRAWRRSWP